MACRRLPATRCTTNWSRTRQARIIAAAPRTSPMADGQSQSSLRNNTRATSGRRSHQTKVSHQAAEIRRRSAAPSTASSAA